MPRKVEEAGVVVPLANAPVESRDEARVAGMRASRGQPVLLEDRRQLAPVLVGVGPLLFGSDGLAAWGVVRVLDRVVAEDLVITLLGG